MFFKPLLEGGDDDNHDDGADGTCQQYRLPIAGEDIEGIDDPDARRDEEEPHVVAQEARHGFQGLRFDDFEAEGGKEQHHADDAPRNEAVEQPGDQFTQAIKEQYDKDSR